MARRMDKERTRAYYAALGPEDLCSCAACRNFSSRVREAYPDSAAFLDGMGADIAKPHESWSLELREGELEYPEVQYVILGSVGDFRPTEISGVRFGLADAWPPTGLEEPHFVIEAGPFRLEWPGEAPE